jgi:hypothetical protein
MKKAEKKDPSRFIWRSGDVKITTPSDKQVELWTKYGTAKKV